jgi:hypothetical protein
VAIFVPIISGSHQNVSDYLVELVNMAIRIGVTRLRTLEKCPKT